MDNALSETCHFLLFACISATGDSGLRTCLLFSSSSSQLPQQEIGVTIRSQATGQLSPGVLPPHLRQTHTHQANSPPLCSALPACIFSQEIPFAIPFRTPQAPLLLLWWASLPATGGSAPTRLQDHPGPEHQVHRPAPTFAARAAPTPTPSFRLLVAAGALGQPQQVCPAAARPLALRAPRSAKVSDAPASGCQRGSGSACLCLHPRPSGRVPSAQRGHLPTARASSRGRGPAPPRGPRRSISPRRAPAAAGAPLPGLGRSRGAWKAVPEPAGNGTPPQAGTLATGQANAQGGGRRPAGVWRGGESLAFILAHAPPTGR